MGKFQTEALPEYHMFSDELYAARSDVADALLMAADFGNQVVEDTSGWVQVGDVCSQKIYFCNQEDPEGTTVVGSFEITFYPDATKVKKYHSLSNKGDLLLDWVDPGDAPQIAFSPAI
jgi:hypothetical protein